jgi:hypothetical protein
LCSSPSSKIIGDESMSKNTKLFLGIVCAVVTLICVFYVGKTVIQSILHQEISVQKKEAMEKMKTLDEDKAAETVAKTIHGIKSFKEKVKEKINRLDSADTNTHKEIRNRLEAQKSK